jgi:hypothetical protein
LDPIIHVRAGKITAQAASAEVARRFAEWIRVFESARSA